MEPRIQLNIKGHPFRILLVGNPTEINIYVQFLKKMGLKEETETNNSLKGTATFDDDDQAFSIHLSIITPEKFKEIEKSELKYDGIIFYQKDADLREMPTIEPYRGWQQWGNGEVIGLAILGAAIVPYGKFYGIVAENGELGMKYAFGDYFRALQIPKKNQQVSDEAL